MPFEQVKSYFGNSIEDVLFISYKGLDKYTQNKCDTRKWKRFVEEEKSALADEKNGTIRMLAHNSMCKFSITKIKGKGGEPEYNKSRHFRMDAHPLAYMLMLCDELQCWDRTSYGQNSRQEFHPMWCDLTFEGNQIAAHYDYDMEFGEERKNTGTYKKMQPAEKEEKSGFLKDIETIIRINEDGTEGIVLSVDTRITENNRHTNQYISNSSFLHLYNFAVALNAMYNARSYETGEWIDISETEMEAQFDKLSLE